jgi:PAS domain S-box-containing protein
LFGHAASALRGQSMRCLFTPDDVDMHIPEFELKVAAISDDMNNDRWMQRADGSRFWATGNTVGLRDKAQKVIGFAKILRDSTDVKEQLETARNQCKILAESDRHKTKFLATLSHEVRNPLSAMANGLEFIKARPETGLEAMAMMERQLKHLNRLADDLLDLTRISTGKVDLDLQVVDIREPLANAVESVRPQMERRRHGFSQHILDTPMMIKADKLRLEQVFANLLTNATKYTPDGGHIELRASTGPAEAWVHVIDNGMGIPRDTLPHVFELFTRGDGASEHAKDGLGIGLSLVKEFVRLHGGTVQVRSDGHGLGSEFTVRLPLAQPIGSEMSVAKPAPS